MPTYANLAAGDTAPWFHQRTPANKRYAFDTAGGRYLVLCFFGSAADAHSRAAIKAALSRRQIFDDTTASFFGVSLDVADESEKRVRDSYPGYRFFWDFDGTASRLYGVYPKDVVKVREGVAARRRWVVLDPTLRVLKVIPFAGDQSDIAELLSYVDALPPPSHFTGYPSHAPILLLPNVFEPEFCEKLIGLYEENGGQESGFMRQVESRTVMVHDTTHKRRKDHTITDPEFIQRTRGLINRRIVPQILKAHQFSVTRMERFLVCCYAAEDEAHFRAHRDNTTTGTAHRRFAVSINLNNDFDGGEVSFPEYGPQSYKPPVGGAAVFSCSLLHAVSKVTRGRRYAFLPFLYDDEAAKIREANSKFIDDAAAQEKPPAV